MKHEIFKGILTRAIFAAALCLPLSTARWRYTEWGPGGKDGIELYDNSRDPGEYYNLARKPEFAETSKELTKLLKQGFPKNR